MPWLVYMLACPSIFSVGGSHYSGIVCVRVVYDDFLFWSCSAFVPDKQRLAESWAAMVWVSINLSVCLCFSHYSGK